MPPSSHPLIGQFLTCPFLAQVYLATWREIEVAAKVLISPELLEQNPDVLELPEATLRELHKEADIMSRIRHPNVVSFLGLCSLPPCILTGGLAAVAAVPWDRARLEAAAGRLSMKVQYPPCIANQVSIMCSCRVLCQRQCLRASLSSAQGSAQL